MWRWFAWSLWAGCTAPSNPDAPARSEVGDCDPGGATELAVIQTLTFAREVDGTSVGFDLDGEVTSARDDTGCGVEDATAPDGTEGIDNALARLLPALELTEGQALEAIVAEAIKNGGLLILMELDDVDDPTDDACVSLRVMGGMGRPLVGNDGLILPSQTFDRDPEAPVSHLPDLALADGVVEGGPIDLDLPFTFLDADVVFEVTSGQVRLERHDDGRIHGIVGGGIAIQALSDLAHDTGIGEEVEDLLDSVLGNIADLSPGPDGTCEQVSVAMEFEAVQAFFYPE